MNNQEQRNPILELPRETAGFLRQLRSTLELGRDQEEEGLSDAQFISMRLAEVLASRDWLPADFDKKRYVELVGRVEQLESSLQRIHPSIAVEEAALALRGNIEGASELHALKQELLGMDEILGEASGLSVGTAHKHIQDEKMLKHIRDVERDRKEEDARLVKERAEKHYGFARKLYLESKLGTTILDIPDHIRAAIEQMQSGMEYDELAPIPPKGEFQQLEDVATAENDIPALIYERQIVRTERNVMSPDFSGCASVLLYREGADGRPEKSSIFAHLPPHTKTGFTSYNKNFWLQQAGISDLTGYKAKVVAGLIRSPQEIAFGLQSLGADVVTVDQVPLEMYSVLVDADTKEMVAVGQLEQIAESATESAYKTIDGNVLIKNYDGPVKGVAYIP